MSASAKLRKLLADPAGVTRRVLRRLLHPEGVPYEPASYWAERHATCGFDPRGVGRIDTATADNEEMVREGNAAMRALWRREGIAASAISLLDVGCGQGHHAQNFADEGGTRYTGVDITDVLFPRLRARFPGFRFERVDASREPLPGEHDVIVMVNVAEHIVDADLFAFAMDNVRTHLSAGGLFIVTVPEGPPPAARAAHWAYWPLEALLPHFPGYTATAPTPFWDKSVVVLRPR